MLLLVVLSMLVLFMLIGTAFLMSSNQARDAAKKAAKWNRVGNYPTKFLDRALLQVLRDTENTASVVRGHGLLRDLYGTDGFQGTIYNASYARRYGNPLPDTTPLGATNGQFIDLIVIDNITPILTTRAQEPQINEVIKLDRDAQGRTIDAALPLTRGYYNGCLLTIAGGQASGQSTRIVDYEFIGPKTINSVDVNQFRFRVMSFPRSDGVTLAVTPANGTTPPLLEELKDANFLVNGRAFSGTGVGYNPFAATPGPKLNAREGIFLGTNPPLPTSIPNPDVIYPPIALVPNAAFFFPFDPGNQAASDIWGARYANSANGKYDPLNPLSVALLNRQAQWKYQSFDGPGGGNEGYDAPDYQNMALGMQTVTPRPQGRVVQGTSSSFVTLDVTDSALDPTAFLRLDLEDVPLPSFHRPDLTNYWYHQLVQYLINVESLGADQAVQAVLQPYDSSWNPQFSITANQAAQITALKRKISLRPLREDHPHFDGGNPLSVPKGLNNISNLLKNGNIAIPYWEAVGPWDVDNDNDGVPDSIWIDLGDPVQQADDGTLYKPLYAFLILDMDGRLNVNAHGLVDDIGPVDPNLDSTNHQPNALANGSLAGTFKSTILPRGVGYGPPEISLRPVFPMPWTNASGATDFGNRFEVNSGNRPVDDYAALLGGRVPVGNDGIPGRYGYDGTDSSPKQGPAPGTNYLYQADNNSPTGDKTLPDLAARIKFFNYPLTINQRTSYGTPPDLFARYALGLDYGGQPYYEVLNDASPNNNTYPHALLTKSPYELDLSNAVRRDGWSSARYGNSTQEFNASVELHNWQPNGQYVAAPLQAGLNDDAPYSASDLERILRAADADTGALPSRLWDVVSALDPVKLSTNDYFRVEKTAQLAFNLGTSKPSQAELLAAAQQMSSIYRRLVTTDSYDLPVASITPPAYLLTHQNATIQEHLNSRLPKNMAEIFEMRIRRMLGGPTMFDEYEPGGDHDGDGTPNATDPDYNSAAEVAVRKVRTARINAIINGGTWVDANNVTHVETGIVAPDLIAGLRMDLNRPFGDGQDNNANGVVDDPLEAGDPFLDLNGNGKWDGTRPVEPFLNVDGSINAKDDPTYTPPQDQLWNGIMGEPIAFDYTNGQGVPLHPAVTANLGLNPNVDHPVIRNLESQGRQLYARQLYCLMLLLADENYIAPYDENDRAIAGYLDFNATGSQAKAVHDALVAGPSPTTADQDTRRIMLRKLTCRTIAQWAINAADARDSDVIMTPFEYDENPWDGWGCLDPNGVNIPLDGDAATDENLGAVIDWKATAANGAKTISVTSSSGPGLVPAPAVSEQTRGLVWGAERPELLITETIGLHNRNTEDLGSDFTKQQLEANSTSTPPKDDDLDQRLRPKGSAFIELVNPQSPTGQYPADLYSTLTNNGGQVGVAPSDGVELGRLSTLGVTVPATGMGDLTRMIDIPLNVNDPIPTAPPAVLRSPVWRMIVVEENPVLRNDSEGYDDDMKNNLGTGVHKTAVKLPGTTSFKPIDPDWGQFYGQNPPPTGFPAAGTFDKPYIERSIYFTSGNSPRFKQFDNDDPSGANENFLSVKPDKAGTRNLKILVPPESAKSARYFITADTNDANARDKNNGNNVRDVVIARIKPGRYAVVGTAGAQYQGKRDRIVKGLNLAGQPISATAPRYVSTIARPLLGGNQAKFQTLDDRMVNNLDKARRIELLPSINPDVQQILVGSNGGTPLFPNNVPRMMRRDNEVVKTANGQFRNIYDFSGDPEGAGDSYVPNPDTGLIPPCVAIPIKDLSISEPLDLYVARRKQLDKEEKARHDADPQNTNLLSHYYNPEAAMGEGMFVGGPRGQTPETPYDTPFDIAPELKRNGTTRNYRTIYLQRLADPTLPWNPLSTYPDGKANPSHNPKLPINLYLTIDASSIDLTAFNGASSREPDMAPNTVRDEHKLLPENKPEKFRPEYGLTGTQRIHMHSLERGSHNASPTTTGDLLLAPRLLWRHEPITRFSATDFTKNDMLTWLTIDPMDANQRKVELGKRAEDLRLRSRDELNKDIDAVNTLGLDADYASFPDALKPLPAQFDIVMNHSLGFQNESFGAMISNNDANRLGLPASADGKPAPDTPNFLRTSTPPLTANINSTFPWLASNNRPFVSAEELLGVPATSSFKLLADYSTINANGPTINPYDGTSKTANGERLQISQAPFGHLLNFFATSLSPATSQLVNAADKDYTNKGAANFYRLLEYVQVPSRFVGTDTMLTAEIFNDVPGANDSQNTPGIAMGSDITGPDDPRYKFQPPYNKVSRERDPGRVNLNTVAGRRAAGSPATIWSDVYDGIMHRTHDGVDPTSPLGHMGPAWRDIALSRRGYAQFNADSTAAPVEKISGNPDLFASGLNPNFPSIFSNPFRSPDAGDLVPLDQLMQYGVDASMLRVHPYARGANKVWGPAPSSLNDARAAGFGDDQLAYRSNTNDLGGIPRSDFANREIVPLFSDTWNQPFADSERNPSMLYNPSTRLGNLVTNRSNVYAIWITVGYFEVEKAPSWNEPIDATRKITRDRFGASNVIVVPPATPPPADARGQALYNRVYPDGYMLGKELGSETGDTHRQRGFYIIDRTVPVGFKPGEDLNVENMIRLRRRIE